MNKPTTIDDLFDLFASKEISFDEILHQSGHTNAEEVNEALQLHLSAARAVKRYAIQQQVAEIHKIYAPEKVREITTQAAPVKTMPVAGSGKWMMRIAASVALLVGLYTTQYVVFFSPDKMYKSTFSEYYVNTERSTTLVTENEISSSFRKGDFNKVVSLYKNDAGFSNREKFLAGYSHIQLNNFADAEKLFSEILQTNQQTGNGYFQDEAEYYLAMVQLKLGKTDSARSLLEKIHANKEHTFYESVSSWMIFRMKFY